MPMMVLLAPLQELHLQSGLETEAATGKVAFGCGASKLFHILEHGADVLICATPCRHPEPVVTWRAVFRGYVPGIHGAHPAGTKYRPQSTADDTDWDAYWEVSELKSLPKSEWIPVDSLRSFKTGNLYQAHIPRRPVLVQLPF